MKLQRIICILLFSFVVNGQTVYKTANGEKYHLATCQMIKNGSEKLTLNEAKQQKLTPCEICKPPKKVGETNTVQCKAKTKAGKRCKNMTKIASGYCVQHNPEKVK